MPIQPGRACGRPGCRGIVRAGVCDACGPRSRGRPRIAARPDARPSAARRGYGRAWREAARRHLAGAPLCVSCLAAGRVTPATVVDHVVPHRGDAGLFWAPGNWQSLCACCHARKTAAGE